MQGNTVAADILNKEVLKNEAAYSQAFASARPFRHVVIDDFLSGDFCREVCNQFPAFDEKRALNEDGYIGGKATQEKVRALGPAFSRLDEIIQQRPFLSLVERITGVSGLYYDRFYYGGGTHENRQGQSLDPHVDFNYHPITRQHRRLNLIIYLNDEWDDRWGGSLQLHEDPYLEPDQDRIVTVTPLLNRCVIFETNEHSWHGFEAINLPADRQNLSRKSFALYFYTDERPEEESAEEHSTVYVERHLPQRFAPGMTLDQADLQEIRILLARRDQHLKRLYSKVQGQNGTIRKLRNRSGPLSPQSLESIEVPENAREAVEMISLLQSRIIELESSTSWRLTAPLRAVKRLLTGKS